MKNPLKISVLLGCFWLMSCGGATEAAPETMNEAPFEVTEPEPPPPPPVRKKEPPPQQEPIKRVAPVDQDKCAVFDQEDGTQMVMSHENDWFLYVSAEAKVECGTFGGNVTITEGVLEITVKPLIPQGVSGKEAEETLRDQSVRFIRSGLQSEYGSGRDLAFEKVKLGKHKRPALCADAELNMKGMPGRVVACVTSKTNISDEVVVHRAVWVSDASAYDASATPKRVKEAAANWFRYSDTDGFGKILRKW
ncbi:MAG: hypothetical protein JXR76_04180 [Deltaproteobacteria bacterium]|nr:hypothetical protein [Deltaproteobacteria bacterium]